MCELILIRHGQTVGNSAVRFYGATDIELSDQGREQMRRAGLALEGLSFDRAFTSPLQRAQESARLALNGAADKITIIDAFTELDFGRWEGWTTEEIAERDPEAHQRHLDAGTDAAFPEGDSKPEFRLRIRRAARRLFDQTTGRDIAVLHKGVIRYIISELLDLTVEDALAMDFELGGIYRLKRENGAWRVTSTNETDHLGDVRVPESA